MTKTQQGILFIVMAASGYAMLPIFAKFGYEAGFAPLDMLTWRFVLATPLIWLLARTDRANKQPLPYLRLLALGLMFSVMAMQAFFALDRIPASTYIVITYLYPGFVALFSLLEGEKLPNFGWTALALTTVGVALTAPNFATGLSGDTFGLFLAFINGLSYAVYILISNRLLRGYTALATVSAFTITGAAIVFIGINLFRPLAFPQEIDGWLIVIGVAVISTVLPIFAFYAGVQRLGAPQAALLGAIEPVLVLLLSFVLLGETMQPIQLAGGGLILCGALLLQLGRLRKLEKPQVIPQT